jgi:hypothetical protein
VASRGTARHRPDDLDARLLRVAGDGQGRRPRAVVRAGAGRHRRRARRANASTGARRRTPAVRRESDALRGWQAYPLHARDGAVADAALDPAHAWRRSRPSIARTSTSTRRPNSCAYATS